MLLIMFIVTCMIAVGLFSTGRPSHRWRWRSEQDPADPALLAANARKAWWRKRRWRYNMGLVAAGALAFLAYAVLGDRLIAPHDPRYEVTLFTMVVQGITYLFMMAIANVLYGLGPLADETLNRKERPEFRERLFRLGFWFSVALPFVIPLGIVVEYFRHYHQ